MFPEAEAGWRVPDPVLYLLFFKMQRYEKK
jgi:hypothetical protein